MQQTGTMIVVSFCTDPETLIGIVPNEAQARELMDKFHSETTSEGFVIGEECIMAGNNYRLFPIIEAGEDSTDWDECFIWREVPLFK